MAIHIMHLVAFGYGNRGLDWKALFERKGCESWHQKCNQSRKIYHHPRIIKYLGIGLCSFSHHSLRGCIKDIGQNYSPASNPLICRTLGIAVCICQTSGLQSNTLLIWALLSIPLHSELWGPMPCIPHTALMAICLEWGTRVRWQAVWRCVDR